MSYDVKRRGRQWRRVIVLSLSFLFLASFLSSATVSGRVEQQQALSAPTDPAAVERGRELMAQQCGFCHGSNARGGSSGPDLTRSVVVQEDENGRQLGEFLRAGRPDRGMPRFEFTEAQNRDLAAFLHAAIYQNSNRRLYKILDIVVGDPKTGEAYFNGVGKCASCHSTSRDLQGIGAKYDPVTLQQRLLVPRGRPSQRGPAGPPYMEPTALKATVTPSSGPAVTGGLVRLTDFEVTLYDSAEKRIRSWTRNGDVPKVAVVDPLQAHLDQLPKWTDADVHNMTAYLAGVK